MEQHILEVREKITILLSGIVLLVAGIIMTASAFVVEDTESATMTLGIIGLVVAVLGIYCFMAYFNHRLKVFVNGRMIYTNTFGKKSEFHYSDIATVDQRMRKSTLSLSFLDVSGKRLGKLESNMKGYEELGQWLNQQKQKAEDAVSLGAATSYAADVTAVNEKRSGVVTRIIWFVAGIALVVIGGLCLYSLVEEDATEQTEALAWFDPYTASEEKQMLEVAMISYPFASFELSDTQNLYFALDEYMTVYIVCMDTEKFETEFADIYEYTYSSTMEFPGVVQIDGYASEIDEELESLIIEEFNYFWGSEVFSEEKLEEYVGCYYLDNTFKPGSGEENPITNGLAGVFFVGMGIYLIYLSIRRKKQEIPAPREVAMPADASAEGLGITHTEETIGEIAIPGNIFVAMLASIVCALGGGIVWILFFKMGRITSFAGLLAVVGAIYGYSKFGKRELTVGASIWCIIVGLGAIAGANFFAYAWDIADVINASHPGRTDIIKVLGNMSWLMEDMGLWKDFFADLGLGVFFAIVGGVGSLFGKKKE